MRLDAQWNIIMHHPPPESADVLLSDTWQACCYGKLVAWQACC